MDREPWRAAVHGVTESDTTVRLKGLYIPSKCHNGFYKFTSKYCQQEHILKFFLASAEA